MDVRRRFLNSGPNKEAEDDVIRYTVDLNEQWVLSTTQSNPDNELYDGVYESTSNWHVPSSCSKMVITTYGLDSFTLYIRSYGESYYDYVMVSQLDKDIDHNTSYLYSELVKDHTRGVYSSDTSISSYKQVKFENIGGGEHTITVIYLKDAGGDQYEDRGYLLISKDYTISDEPGYEPPIDDVMNIDNYLTIEPLEDGLTAYLSTNNCEYCIDGSDEWVSLNAGTLTPAINVGQTISFRGNLQPVPNTGIGTFTISKSCNLRGNCNSMLFGDNAANNYSLSGYNYAYYRLFYGCSNIVNVSKGFLPSVVVSSNCYYYMFYGCTSLVTAPDLPATILAGSCYYYMFYNCTSLVEAPDLPAETLQNYCYYGMFYKCSSLTKAPVISATTVSYHCCYYMFYSCSSLVTAPDLLALKLESYCYYSMFNQCSEMLYIKMLATDVSASGCLTNWVKKVERQGGIFTKNINATWSISGDNGVPKKWSIQYYNPETGETTT